MKICSPIQAIEFFHLLFLLHLSKVLNPNFFIVKGGCNLRFFMKSIRYSEGLDLDVLTTSLTTLKKNVDKVFGAASFNKNLQANGLSVEAFSAPKQTTTTQRWKAMIKIAERTLNVPTKIECSRRESTFSYQYDPIDPDIIHEYRLFPISANHYTVTASIYQKIKALAYRKEVQCRDIFDLYLLGQKKTAQTQEPANPLTHQTCEQAAHNCLLPSFQDFKSQVVAYLMSDYQREYYHAHSWQHIQQCVHENILQCRHAAHSSL